MTAETQPTDTSLVEAVWRYRTMSLLIVLACALAAVGVTQILFSGVQAKARFAVTDPTNGGNVLHMGVVSATGFATYTAQRAAFANSAPVLKQAAQILASHGGPKLSLEKMRADVKTATKPDGGVVEVTGAAGSMQVAAGIANAVVQSYQQLTAQAVKDKVNKQLEALKTAEKKVADNLRLVKGNSKSTASLTANLAKLQGQESALLADANNSSDGVQFVDTADPTASAPSKLPRNGVIGIAIGVLMACVASFLRASAPARRRSGPIGPAASLPAAPAGPPPVVKQPVGRPAETNGFNGGPTHRGEFRLPVDEEFRPDNGHRTPVNQDFRPPPTNGHRPPAESTRHELRSAAPPAEQQRNGYRTPEEKAREALGLPAETAEPKTSGDRRGKHSAATDAPDDEPPAARFDSAFAESAQDDEDDWAPPPTPEWLHHEEQAALEPAAEDREDDESPATTTRRDLTFISYEDDPKT